MAALKFIKHTGVGFERFHSVAKTQLLGPYDYKESIYYGDGYARGIMEDPESLDFPLHGSLKVEITIVELLGEDYFQTQVLDISNILRKNWDSAISFL